MNVKPKRYTKALHLRADDEFLTKLEAICRHENAQSGITNRSDIVRKLVIVRYDEIAKTSSSRKISRKSGEAS
jgi:hypothetical protein